MEGSANIRQRGHRRKSWPELILSTAVNFDEKASFPKDKKTDTMAAGSSRIIRYVLFAFFVGLLRSKSLATANHPVRV